MESAFPGKLTIDGYELYDDELAEREADEAAEDALWYRMATHLQRMILLDTPDNGRPN